MNNRYNRQGPGQLAQLVSLPKPSKPILRLLWIAILATLFFLRWAGLALTLVLLGQFWSAAVEYRRFYGRKRALRKGPA